MAIVNRSLDISQQREVYNARVPTTAVGSSTLISLFNVPYQSALRGAAIACEGVSGAVVGSVAVNRFVPGAGLTAILVAGASMALQNLGTSGVQGFTVPIGGSVFQLLQGDIVSLVLVGGNNILEAQVCLVLTALQDIKSPLGITA